MKDIRKFEFEMGAFERLSSFLSFFEEIRDEASLLQALVDERKEDTKDRKHELLQTAPV